MTRIGRRRTDPPAAIVPQEEPSETDRLKPLRLSAAAFAALVGMFALIGWGFNLDWLTRLAPGMTATNPMTAVAFILAALALALGPRRLVPVRILASLLLGIGAARLAAILAGLRFDIDLQLFADQLGRAGDFTASRMVADTALSLILIGCALLLSGSRNRRFAHVAQIQCAIVIAIALFVVVGYGLDLVALHGVIRIRMSFYTALALMALAVGTASISSETRITRVILDRGVAGSMARSALPFALFASVLVGTAEGAPLQVFTHLLVTSAMLAGCILALLRADRMRRRRELATEQSEGYYRHAEQVGHIGHWRIDSFTGAIQWSDEVTAILGLPKGTIPNLEEGLGSFHPDDLETRAVVEHALEECLDWEIGHRVMRPNGEVRHVRSLGVCERDAQGQPIAMFGVVIDVTELEAARREAEAATASKAAFLANMSHEIRTPMNGVMGFVELLMDSKLDANQRRHLLLVQESAQALLKLLNDILDLSKIEAGLLDLSAEPSNVRHDIKQCVRLMTPAVEQKGLALEVSFADGFPKSVLIDSLRFRQILFNLLGNAVKFTNQGSVSVTLREAPGPRGKRIIEVKVADTGVGIADERKAAIFDAFVQADASVSRRFGGSGLGLSISRSLAALMGGTIALESQENEGTVVTLTLPLDEVFVPATAAGRSAASPGPIAGAEAPERRQASILLVEDIDINRELITEMLNRLGHKVDLAVNGAEALALACRLELEPNAWDLILMDVQMPVMDGLTATRSIRALGGRAATIPIVALTANAFAAEMEECREAGMDDHIAKPCGFAQLEQTVELWGEIAQSPAPPIGFGALETVSIADRFEARLRKSSERLIELTAELCAAEQDLAAELMREAAGLAHVLAGTAGMFGRGSLGMVAQRVEAEIKALSSDDPMRANDAARQAIDKLIAALDAPAQQSEPHAPARAA